MQLLLVALLINGGTNALSSDDAIAAEITHLRSVSNRVTGERAGRNSASFDSNRKWNTREKGLFVMSNIQQICFDKVLERAVPGITFNKTEFFLHQVTRSLACIAQHETATRKFEKLEDAVKAYNEGPLWGETEYFTNWTTNAHDCLQALLYIEPTVHFNDEMLFSSAISAAVGKYSTLLYYVKPNEGEEGDISDLVDIQATAAFQKLLDSIFEVFHRTLPCWDGAWTGYRKNLLGNILKVTREVAAQWIPFESSELRRGSWADYQFLKKALKDAEDAPASDRKHHQLITEVVLHWIVAIPDIRISDALTYMFNLEGPQQYPYASRCPWEATADEKRNLLGFIKKKGICAFPWKPSSVCGQRGAKYCAAGMAERVFKLATILNSKELMAEAAQLTTLSPVGDADDNFIYKKPEADTKVQVLSVCSENPLMKERKCKDRSDINASECDEATSSETCLARLTMEEWSKSGSKDDWKGDIPCKMNLNCDRIFRYDVSSGLLMQSIHGNFAAGSGKCVEMPVNLTHQVMIKDCDPSNKRQAMSENLVEKVNCEGVKDFTEAKTGSGIGICEVFAISPQANPELCLDASDGVRFKPCVKTDPKQHFQKSLFFARPENNPYFKRKNLLRRILETTWLNICQERADCFGKFLRETDAWNWSMMQYAMYKISKTGMISFRRDGTLTTILGILGGKEFVQDPTAIFPQRAKKNIFKIEVAKEITNAFIQEGKFNENDVKEVHMLIMAGMDSANAVIGNAQFQAGILKPLVMASGPDVVVQLARIMRGADVQRGSTSQARCNISRGMYDTRMPRRFKQQFSQNIISEMIGLVRVWNSKMVDPACEVRASETCITLEKQGKSSNYCAKEFEEMKKNKRECSRQVYDRAILEIILLGAQCYGLFHLQANLFLNLTEGLDFESLNGILDADRNTGYLDQLFNATVFADRILSQELEESANFTNFYFPRWKDYIDLLRKRIMSRKFPKTYDGGVHLIVIRSRTLLTIVLVILFIVIVVPLLSETILAQVFRLPAADAGILSLLLAFFGIFAKVKPSLDGLMRGELLVVQKVIGVINGVVVTSISTVTYVILPKYMGCEYHMPWQMIYLQVLNLFIAAAWYKQVQDWRASHKDAGDRATAIDEELIQELQQKRAKIEGTVLSYPDGQTAEVEWPLRSGFGAQLSLSQNRTVKLERSAQGEPVRMTVERAKLQIESSRQDSLRQDSLASQQRMVKDLIGENDPDAKEILMFLDKIEDYTLLTKSLQRVIYVGMVILSFMPAVIELMSLFFFSESLTAPNGDFGYSIGPVFLHDLQPCLQGEGRYVAWMLNDLGAILVRWWIGYLVLQFVAVPMALFFKQSSLSLMFKNEFPHKKALLSVKRASIWVAVRIYVFDKTMQPWKIIQPCFNILILGWLVMSVHVAYAFVFTHGGFEWSDIAFLRLVGCQVCLSIPVALVILTCAVVNDNFASHWDVLSKELMCLDISDERRQSLEIIQNDLIRTEPGLSILEIRITKPLLYILATAAMPSCVRFLSSQVSG